MAIGDKPNQNLFGTNYNPEDEERKKAELAAQGAMMGAGFPALDSNIVAQVPGIENIKNPGAFNPPEPALKNALLGMLERADAREAQGLPRQAAPGIIDAPAETPSVGAQEQPGAVVSPFLQSPDTPSGLGGPLLDGFNRVNDSFRAPNAPMGQDATRAALGGMTLNEYLNAPAGTEGVSGLRTDPQGRMIPNPAPAAVNNFAPQTSNVGGSFVPMPILEGNPVPMPGTGQGNLIRGPFRGDPAFSNGPATPPPAFSTRPSPLSPDGGFRVTGGNSVGVTQTPGSNLSPFEQASLERQQRIGGTGSFASDSAAREARIDSRPDFNDARSDRDRRAARGDGPSMADLTDMAKANAPDATPREVARGNQVANALGVDLKTGQATGALKPSDILARERFEFDKQQALIGDDTSDNATTRKIATIKQANPDISDADAAAIASGSVKVVSNDLTGVTQLLNIATGESRQIESQAAPDVNFDVAVPEQTLFSRAGDFTGFVEATKRKAQGITGQVGLDVATEESLGAAQDFETAQNELVRAFRESSRYAASEAAALKKELNISLSPFEDPKSAEAKLRSIDKSLARRYENEVATFKDTTFGSDDRQDARMRAKAIAEFRANLGVPPEGQGSTSSTQGKVPQGVDPKDWAFMTEEQRNLFN